MGRSWARSLPIHKVTTGSLEVPLAAKIFAEVIDRGVNYVDTARSYGIAEEALSQILPTRREKIFLVTKLWTESGEQAQKLFEQSLRTLKTDYLDLVRALPDFYVVTGAAPE